MTMSSTCKALTSVSSRCSLPRFPRIEGDFDLCAEVSEGVVSGSTRIASELGAVGSTTVGSTVLVSSSSLEGTSAKYASSVSGVIEVVDA